MNQRTMFTYSAFIQRLFKPVSIKQKLMAIIMAVSLIGLVMVGASILINELINLNRMQKVDLQVLADIVAETSSGFLVFNDDAGAAISLAALRSKKQIVRAILYDKNKDVFVVHSRAGSAGKNSYEEIKNKNLESGIFYVLKEINIDDELIGYLYLESDYSLINDFVFDSIAGMIFIIILGALIAYVLALKLQKIISDPIVHLTETALKITQQQNYELRAEKESEDEIGVLTDEFNKMLVQLQKRNKELIESENKFREVVEQSTDALFIIGRNGEFIDVNNAACISLGYKRSELLKMGVVDIDAIYNDEESMKRLLIKLSEKNHIIVESEHIKKTRQSFPVELSLGYLNIDGRQLILASVRDITERKQAQINLQMANDLLEAKVNERTQELKAINVVLESAKKKAEAASYAKSLFLANMSHEIRTPMNAVIGFTDLLSSSDLSSQQTGYVKSIQSGSRNLLSLINDILDLSKIEAGKIKIKFDKVNVKQLLKDIYQVFSILAKEKGLVLKLHIDNSVPDLIMSDEIRLRQILFNLLNNAIKFTRKGEINVYADYRRVSADDIFSSMTFSVEDTGIGVQKSDQKNIFNIFEQQDNQSTREFGGAGLGLAISTRLAEKLGASITVKSESGKGSVFQLVLHSPEIVEDNNVKEVQRVSSNIIFKPAKILVVDDIKLNRELVCEYLAKQPLTLVVAKDGVEALDLVKSELPDLVLMDIRMPKMNGIEATEIIKKTPEFSKIPVVAITASVIEDRKSSKKRSLFDLVLYKPLNRKTLIKALTKFIEVEVVKDVSENITDFSSMFHNEIKTANYDVVENLVKFRQPLEKAKNRGSFGSLDKMLNELSEVAIEFKLTGLCNMVKDLKSANQDFDVEETQKLISKILTGIDQLPGGES
ncbi:MAG: ATP-binding protein [Methylococcales bacterium]